MSWPPATGDLVAGTGANRKATDREGGAERSGERNRGPTYRNRTGMPRIIFEENSGLADVILIDFVKETIEDSRAIDRPLADIKLPGDGSFFGPNSQEHTRFPFGFSR